MTTPPALELYGLASHVRISIEGSRAQELEDALREAWVRCSTPQREFVDAGDLRAGLGAKGEQLDPGLDISGDSLAAVLQQVTRKVTYAFIAAQAGRLAMLHAGACADPRTGGAVAFVAPGGTGKTTLARTLGQRLGYLTDETVGMNTDGLIAPYEKPLSIRQGELFGPKTETSPEDLDLLSAPDAPRIRRIVLLQRSEGLRTEPVWTELSLGDAIVALIPESSSLSRLPRPLHVLKDLIEETEPVLRCEYRECDDILDQMCELVRS